MSSILFIIFVFDEINHLRYNQNINMPDRSAAEIKILISILLKYSQRDMEKNLAKMGLGVSPLAFKVLHSLVSGEQTIKQLSEKMNLAAATLVPVVNTLEVKKLISRRADKNDRRRLLLNLTKIGEKTMAKISSDSQSGLIARRLKEMGPEDTKKLLATLYKLVSRIVGQKELDAIWQKVHGFWEKA